MLLSHLRIGEVPCNLPSAATGRMRRKRAIRNSVLAGADVLVCLMLASESFCWLHQRGFFLEGISASLQGPGLRSSSGVLGAGNRTRNLARKGRSGRCPMARRRIPARQRADRIGTAQESLGALRCGFSFTKPAFRSAVLPLNSAGRAFCSVRSDRSRPRAQTCV